MRWLLDEMLPPTTAELLNERGHDAVSVQAAGLAGAADPDVFDHAVAEQRLVVTENFATIRCSSCNASATTNRAYQSSSSTSPTSRRAARSRCTWRRALMRGRRPTPSHTSVLIGRRPSAEPTAKHVDNLALTRPCKAQFS